MEEKMITELLSAIQKVLPAMQDYHKMIQHQGELIVQIQKMNISIQNIERNIINHDHDLRGIELKFTKVAELCGVRHTHDLALSNFGKDIDELREDHEELKTNVKKLDDRIEEKPIKKEISKTQKLQRISGFVALIIGIFTIISLSTGGIIFVLKEILHLIQ